MLLLYSTSITSQGSQYDDTESSIFVDYLYLSAGTRFGASTLLDGHRIEKHGTSSINLEPLTTDLLSLLAVLTDIRRKHAACPQSGIIPYGRVDHASEKGSAAARCHTW